MRSIFFSLFFFLMIGLSAQTGFTGGYFNQTFPAWETVVLGNQRSEQLLSNGFSAELDYRITPIKNYRVEIYPAIAYQKASSEHLTSNSTQLNFDWQLYDFSLKSNFYLLSMEADCDCPTFSKQAGLLEKGFFIQIAPGIAHYSGSLENNRISSTTTSGLLFKVGAGVGLDIGLTEMINLSPVVKYQHFFGASWEGLTESLIISEPDISPDDKDQSDVRQFYAGVRLGIRLR